MSFDALFCCTVCFSHKHQQPLSDQHLLLEHSKAHRLKPLPPSLVFTQPPPALLYMAALHALQASGCCFACLQPGTAFGSKRGNCRCSLSIKRQHPG